MTQAERELGRTQTRCLLPLVALIGVLAWCGALGCTYPIVMVRPATVEPPAQIRLYKALDQLKPGMSRPEVQTVFGQAMAKKWSDDPHIVAYEITVERRVGNSVPKTETERLWFYFQDGALIRWGPPGDWPVVEKAPADGPDDAPTAEPK